MQKPACHPLRAGDHASLPKAEASGSSPVSDGPSLSLAESIRKRREDSLRGQIDRWHPRTNSPSDLHPCTRYLVYRRRNWKKRVMHGTELQARFNRGNQEERDVVQELLSLGFDVIQSQARIEIPEIDLSGKIDGKILWKGKAIPFEIKSMHPMVWQRVREHDPKWLLTDPMLAKYYRQIQAYLMGLGAKMGLLLATDCLGHWKIIEIRSDKPAQAGIVGQLRTVNHYLRQKTLPKRIEYGKLCRECVFRTHCRPDETLGDGLEISDDAALDEAAAVVAGAARARREERAARDKLMGAPGRKFSTERYLVEKKQAKKGVRVCVTSISGRSS